MQCKDFFMGLTLTPTLRDVQQLESSYTSPEEKRVGVRSSEESIISCKATAAKEAITASSSKQG